MSGPGPEKSCHIPRKKNYGDLRHQYIYLLHDLSYPFLGPSALQNFFPHTLNPQWQISVWNVLLPGSEHRNRISRCDESTRWLYCSSGKLALQCGPVNYLYNPPRFCVHHCIFWVHQKHMSYSPHPHPPNTLILLPNLCYVKWHLLPSKSTTYIINNRTKLVVLSYYWLYMFCFCGSGSSAGIATDYGLDGPWSNPVGTRFSARPGRTWGPPSLL